MFHLKGKIALDVTRPLIGMVEVERIPLPMLKPRLGPPLEGNPDMGIVMDMIGIGMIGCGRNENRTQSMSPK
jgi:hypothetical protein